LVYACTPRRAAGAGGRFVHFAARQAAVLISLAAAADLGGLIADASADRARNLCHRYLVRCIPATPMSRKGMQMSEALVWARNRRKGLGYAALYVGVVGVDLGFFPVTGLLGG
jgi:hypothetical protein